MIGIHIALDVNLPVTAVSADFRECRPDPPVCPLIERAFRDVEERCDGRSVPLCLEVHVEIDADGITVGLGLIAPKDEFQATRLNGELARIVPPGGISVRKIRGIQWTAAERFARGSARQARQMDLSDVTDEITGLNDGVVVWRQPQRPGAGPGSAIAQAAQERLDGVYGKSAARARLDRNRLLTLLELCERYAELSDEPSPVKTLASEKIMSASQIRNLLYSARQQGLLQGARTASTGDKRGGKAGGGLTQKGILLLAELRKETK